MKQKLKILHLEDLPTDAEMIARELEKGGIQFESRIVSNRKDYTQALKDYFPDIILSDHSLPMFDSREALHILKKSGCTVPFILITSTISEEYAVEIMKDGAYDYILKDRLQRLPKAVLNAMEKWKVEDDKRIFLEEILIKNEELRSLSAHLQTVREEERTSIAREIHDELGQQLTGLKMDVAWIKKKIIVDDPLLNERLSGMISLIDETVKTVRRISSELRPGILDDLGLIAALDWQSQEFEKRSGIPCSFKAEFSDQPFEKSIATGIFRIFQESLTNVARHSGATQVYCNMERIKGNIVLVVADNGKGFNERQAKSKKTLGLIGMKERALMMGGTFKIESATPSGTKIILSVPFREELPFNHV